MSERAEAIAAQVEQATGELAAAIEQSSDEQWRAACAGEGWSIGVTAHHVADAHVGAAFGFIQMVAAGQPVPPITMEMVDQGNAQHAEQNVNCTKSETLELLRRNAATVTGAIRGFTDEQLDRTAPMAFANGAPMSTQQLIQIVILDSTHQHLESIRSAQ